MRDAILGGDVIRRTHAVPDFSAGRYSPELADAPLQDGGADEVFFFRIDGVLGIDIAQGCRVTVHGPGGFDLSCPP